MASALRRRGPLWLILVLVALAAFETLRRGGLDQPVDPGAPEQTYVVERVVDGDTLLLETGERLRLLGVDTPETVKPNHPVERLGREASEFTGRFVEGKRVRLGFDKERRDRYGRLLAYVYVDDLLLNEELLRAGLGEAQLQYPYSNVMKKRFRNAEEEARRAERGLWEKTPVITPAWKGEAPAEPSRPRSHS